MRIIFNSFEDDIADAMAASDIYIQNPVFIHIIHD